MTRPSEPRQVSPAHPKTARRNDPNDTGAHTPAHPDIQDPSNPTTPTPNARLTPNPDTDTMRILVSQRSKISFKTSSLYRMPRPSGPLMPMAPLSRHHITRQDRRPRIPSPILFTCPRTDTHGAACIAANKRPASSASADRSQWRRTHDYKLERQPLQRSTVKKRSLPKSEDCMPTGLLI